MATPKVLAWAIAHKAQAGLAGGAVGAVGIALVRRRKAQAAATSSAAGVPVDATSAAQVVPSASYGDSAGGMPYDPSMGNVGDASSYAAQISQQLAGLSATEAAQTSALQTIATNTRPSAGGTMRVPPPARKPKPKPTRLRARPIVYRTAGHVHEPPPLTRRQRREFGKVPVRRINRRRVRRR